MTVDELKTTLNQAIATLQNNKSIATPQLLDGVDKIIASLSGTATPVAFDTNFQTIFDGISKVVTIERRLVQTNMTDNLIEIMTKIQHHPILMAMMVRIL